MTICSNSRTDIMESGLDPAKWFDKQGFKWRSGISDEAMTMARSDSDVPRGGNRKALIQQLNLMDPTFNRSQVNPFKNSISI